MISGMICSAGTTRSIRIGSKAESSPLAFRLLSVEAWTFCSLAFQFVRSCQKKASLLSQNRNGWTGSIGLRAESAP
jgi:hypothetical protein